MRVAMIMAVFVIACGQANADIRVDVQLEKTTYMVGEVAIGRIDIVNNSTESVSILHGIYDGRVGVRHMLFEGEDVIKTMGTKEGSSSVPPVPVLLGPGEKVTKPLLLLRDKEGLFLARAGIYTYVVSMDLVVEVGSDISRQTIRSSGVGIEVTPAGCGYHDYCEATRGFVTSYVTFFYSFNADNLESYFGDIALYCDYTESLYKIALLNYCSVALKKCMLGKDSITGQHSAVRNKLLLLSGNGKLTLSFAGSPFVDELWSDIENTLSLRIESGGYKEYSDGDIILTNK